MKEELGVVEVEEVKPMHIKKLIQKHLDEIEDFYFLDQCAIK